MSKQLSEAEPRKTGRYVRPQESIDNEQHKIETLSEIIDLGLPYRDMARLWGEKLGKKVHPYSVESFIMRRTELDRRYQKACKNRKEWELEDAVHTVVDMRGKLEELEQRLKVQALKEPAALQDTVAYLMETPGAKQPPWKLYLLFQLHYEGKNSAVIARELGLNPVTVRNLIDAAGNQNTDARGITAPTLPMHIISRIRQLASTHGCSEIARMLNCSRSSVSRYVNMVDSEFDEFARRKA